MVEAVHPVASGNGKASLTLQCQWKGSAHNDPLCVDEQKNADAAGCWLDPTPVAENIRNYVAFSNGVRVVTAEEIGDQRVNPFVTLFRSVMVDK